VTVTSQPDALNIFVKTSTEPKYHAELIASPRRLVIDLEDTGYAWGRIPLTGGIAPVAQIRGSQYRKGVTRIVFDMTHDVGYAFREDEDGLAIVIPTAPGASRAMAMNAGAPPATAAAPAKTDAAVPRPGPTRIAQAPPAPAAPAAPERPSNGSRLISFDFKDADVVNLLRILAAESTKNIVIGDDVKGKMSISLRNVPWDLAFQTILDTRGLQKIEKDGVIRIVSNDQLLKEREAQARVEESKLKAETEIRAKAAEAKLKEQEAIARERAVELELHPPLRGGPRADQEAHPREARRPAASSENRGAPERAEPHRLLRPRRLVGRRGAAPAHHGRRRSGRPRRLGSAQHGRHGPPDHRPDRWHPSRLLQRPLEQPRLSSRANAGAVGRHLPACERGDRPAARRQHRQLPDPPRNLRYAREHRLRAHQPQAQHQPRPRRPRGGEQDPVALEPPGRDHGERQGHDLARRRDPVRHGQLGRHAGPV